MEAVGLDDYVRGVISAEMPSGWSPQALDVQAVAARTYAITTDVSGSNFDLYPDTRSQMYRGVAAETPSTDAAVAATRGQVVTYAGRPGRHLLLQQLRRPHREHRERVAGLDARAVAEGRPGPV